MSLKKHSGPSAAVPYCRIQGRDGLSAKRFFEQGKGFSYDDFNILDTKMTNVVLDQICLSTTLGKEISLYTPVIAAPMDTVTNADLSIALALQGGIAVLHNNHRAPDGRISIDQQVREIETVKRHQSGFIDRPLTVSPTITIGEARERGKQFMVKTQPGSTGSGIIDTFPVTKDGTLASGLVGFLTRECYFADTDGNLKVGSRMYSMNELKNRGMLVYDGNFTEDKARTLLSDNRLRHLLVLKGDDTVGYLVTRKDIVKKTRFPNATRDDSGRLRVLFAISTKDYQERLERGFAAGADGVVVDTSQGFTIFEEAAMRYIEKTFPGKLIIGGNISTAVAARRLESFGMDAFRCGQGSGSICTTQDTIGIGRPGATSVYHCARATSLVTIADGGIRGGGDIVKALSLGAGAVMLGNLLARVDESPGRVVETADGVKMKHYRGMGSLEAMGGVNIRDYGKQAQGVSDYVRGKGSLHDFIPALIDSVKKGLQALNCRSIRELHYAMRRGEIRYETREAGAFVESKPHSLK